MFGIDISPAIGWGIVSALILAAGGLIYNTIRKAGKYDEAKAENKSLGKANDEIRESMEQRTEVEKDYEKIERKIDGGDLTGDELDSVLNSYDYVPKD